MKKGILILIIFSGWMGWQSCQPASAPKEMAEDGYYTCSMHPQVKQPGPGTCPICHMELIHVRAKAEAPGEISLTDEQIRLGNVRMDTVRDGSLSDEWVLTATLNADESRLSSVNARVAGRIDRLYFKNAGDYVPRGAKLYDIYSEELNTAEQEYLAALERKQTLDNSIIDFDRLLRDAKHKLELWGLTETQIQALARDGHASPHCSFYSGEEGYISDLPVAEGDYVQEGGTIVRLANLSVLWAEAQVYASQLAYIDPRGKAMVQIPDLPGFHYEGPVSFVNPEINSGSRVNLLRITIPNTSGRLRPGMPAYVLLKNSSRKGIFLPPDAVLREGKMDVVWVKEGPHLFRMRMVKTGMETPDGVEILSGLRAGEQVVVEGAYLVNSEYRFKRGGESMQGMKM